MAEQLSIMSSKILKSVAAKTSIVLNLENELYVDINAEFFTALPSISALAVSVTAWATPEVEDRRQIIILIHTW